MVTLLVAGQSTPTGGKLATSQPFLTAPERETHQVSSQLALSYLPSTAPERDNSDFIVWRLLNYNSTYLLSASTKESLKNRNILTFQKSRFGSHIPQEGWGNPKFCQQKELPKLACQRSNWVDKDDIWGDLFQVFDQ